MLTTILIMLLAATKISVIPPSYFRYIKYSSYILDTLDILEIFQQIER